MNAPAINRHKSADYVRDPHDWYVEDEPCVDALLDYLALDRGTTILDPHAGGGNLIDRCRARELDAHGSDLIDRGRPDIRTPIDFLTFSGLYAPRSYDWVISNPPFYNGEGHFDFLPNALRVARIGVAMVCPAPLLFSQKRKRLWTSQKPNQLLFLSKRPSMPPGEYLRAGGKRKGGKEDYFWAIWCGEFSLNDYDWL